MTTKSHFETKEQYLTFRSAWAQAVNNERSKKTTYTDEYGTHRKDGWMTGAHMVLFNILRGKPYHRGFSPKTKKNCLLNGGLINLGLYQAVHQLRYMKKQAVEALSWEANPPQEEPYEQLKAKPSLWERITGKTTVTKHRQWPSETFMRNTVQRLEKWLEPLNEVFTIDMLAKLDIPDLKPLAADWAEGRKVARVILAGEANPKNFYELDELVAQMREEAA